MKPFPDNVVLYKKTPEINEESVPAGWMRPHKTNGPVWGKIIVLEGTLEYLINEPQEKVITLNETICGVIEPGILHAVRPNGKVRFYVEFYRSAADAQARQSRKNHRAMCECDECEEEDNSRTRTIIVAAVVVLILAAAGFWYWTAN